MAWPVLPHGFLGASGTSDADVFQVERSLRFVSGDLSYLDFTPSSGTAPTTWTLSFWVKRTVFSATQELFSTRSTASTNQVLQFEFSSSDTLSLVATNTAGSIVVNLNSNAVFRDPAAWYHFVLSVDTTQATASNRIKLYVNGSEITSFATSTYPAQNSNLAAFGASSHNIGTRLLTGSGRDAYLNGYLTEIHGVNGQALTPSSFAESDAITGRWKAKAYTGSYGTNGFYLKFADNSGNTSTTLGKDSSGNGNNWTPANLTVTAGSGNDSLVDSPANYGTDSGVGGEVRGNYCTLNPLDTGTVTLSNGNLDVTFGTASRGTRSTIGISSGKYYFEMTVGAFGTNGPAVGVSYPNANITSNFAGGDANAWTYNGGDGKIYNNNVGTGSNATYTTGDVIGVAVNMDSGTVTFYKNNSAQATTVTGLTGTVFPVVTSGGTAGLQILNFGQRPFTYTAPSGFKGLCTSNLPVPTIQRPSSYVDVVTYTGTGVALSPTSTLGFSPDLVWIKGRSGATDNAIYDSVRGVQLDLVSNSTGGETTQAQGLTAFNSAGFSIGTLAKLNTSSATYVGWLWDENTKAGFDIVGYTGTGTATTVAHGLGVAPKMMIVKARSRSGDDWDVYHSSVGATGRLFLDLTNATNTSSAPWNNTAPTSSVFSVGTAGDTNASGVTYVAYLFSEVDGFSKFGSYTGNGSADGPFIWCGFRPKYVLAKKSSATGPWMVFDSVRDAINVSTTELRPNESTAEPITARGSLDILSNGFKIRSTSATYLGELGDFIFAAFAESPFKYARAR